MFFIRFSPFQEALQRSNVTPHLDMSPFRLNCYSFFASPQWEPVLYPVTRIGAGLFILSPA
jgi:hypothetical protein